MCMCVCIHIFLVFYNTHDWFSVSLPFFWFIRFMKCTFTLGSRLHRGLAHENLPHKHTRGARAAKERIVEKEKYKWRTTNRTYRKIARARTYLCKSVWVCICVIASHTYWPRLSHNFREQTSAFGQNSRYILAHTHTHKHIVCLLIFLLSSRLPCSINL